MTEDFVQPEPWESEPTVPKDELPSPFDLESPPLPESIEETFADVEPAAPPPLPMDVVEDVFPDVEPVTPPAAFAETEFMSAKPVTLPGPEPYAPQPITFGSQPVTFGPPPVTPPPPADYTAADQATPKKSNQTLIIVLIVVAVLLLLCCCCALPIGLILVNPGDIMSGFQYLPLF